MRTELFNSFTKLDETFFKDLEQLWELPTDTLEQLIPFVRKFQFAETTEDLDNLRAEATAEVDAEESKTLLAIKVLRFLQNLWNPLVDDPQDLVQDMRDLNLLPSDQEAAEKFLSRFFAATQDDTDERLKRSFAGAVLPEYVGVRSVVDLRAVFRNQYGTKKEQSVSSYEPECIGFVPVAVVEISRDILEPKDFQFQIEESSLRRLIDNFTAVLKELETVKHTTSRDNA